MAETRQSAKDCMRVAMLPPTVPQTEFREPLRQMLLSFAPGIDICFAPRATSQPGKAVCACREGLATTLMRPLVRQSGLVESSGGRCAVLARTRAAQRAARASRRCVVAAHMSLHTLFS
jgi:hypothetical protein